MRAVATETATLADLAGVAALGVVSTVIAGAILVEANEGWIEPVNLYINALAGPGEAKTPAQKRVIHPLDIVERNRRQRVAPLIVEAEGRKRIAETRRKRLEESAAKATGVDRLEAEDEALQAARQASEVHVPVDPRVYTREATPEALVRLLGEQGGCLGVNTDEGSEFFELAKRYSATGSGNLGIYLAGYDGNRYVSDRAGREPIVIERTTLTVCLLGQPIVLEELGSDRQASGRGLFARFLWSLPSSMVGHRPIHRVPVSDELARAWDDLIVSLASQAEEMTGPGALRLTAQAKHLFDAWRAHHEPRLAPTGDLASIVEWGAKLPGQILRLAGNLHALRTGRLSGVIDDETLQGALDLAGYFTDHTLVVFATMGIDRTTQDAASILRWIEDRGHDEVSTRQVATSKDWQADRTRSALALLAEYGWIRPKKRTNAPGRPSELWESHPAIHGSKRLETPNQTNIAPFRSDDHEISDREWAALGQRIAAVAGSPAHALLAERGYLERHELSPDEYADVLTIIETASAR